ncbi:MAG: tRNA (adenine-N(6)-)-methyltransferase [Flavobacteriales bacterium]|nr:tRNA (adenine-N(6)-)-methyltransferase [Flavobacteriales bacterium]
MSVFKFKKFSIVQSKSAMKVGTDGVLLGSWVNCQSAKKILDIGAGTGLISLMLAQRNNECNITAVEIDKETSEEANININNSKWRDRISIINININNFITSDKFDFIVSNPPYFPANFSKNKRAIARHTNLLSFQDLIRTTVKLLSSKGIFAVILPKIAEAIFCKTADANKLFLIRICQVKGQKNSDIKRVLLEFSFEKSSLDSDSLVIEESRHIYTNKYIDLCQDFYLNM